MKPSFLLAFPIAALCGVSALAGYKIGQNHPRAEPLVRMEPTKMHIPTINHDWTDLQIWCTTSHCSLLNPTNEYLVLPGGKSVNFDHITTGKPSESTIRVGDRQ